MPPPVESPRGPLISRPRQAGTAPARRPARAPATLRDRSRPRAAAEREIAPQRDRGLSLLAIFTVAMLAMVGLAALTAIVGQWWILGPVMLVDLAAMTAVLASIASLLADGDGRSR